MPDSTDHVALLYAIVFGPVLFFLIGSVPFGYLAGLLQGTDLRKQGSGNTGATNVGRVLGKKWAGIVFILDFLKGFLPIYLFTLPRPFPAEHGSGIAGTLCRWLINVCHCPVGESYPLLIMILGVLLVVGHDYSPWLHFKGGKGIATSAGVLAALAPVILAAALTVWAIVLWLSRRVSIGSLAACCTLPIAAFPLYRIYPSIFILSLSLGALGIWRHRANIARLINGTEPRIGGAS